MLTDADKRSGKSGGFTFQSNVREREQFYPFLVAERIQKPQSSQPPRVIKFINDEEAKIAHETIEKMKQLPLWENDTGYTYRMYTPETVRQIKDDTDTDSMKSFVDSREIYCGQTKDVASRQSTRKAASHNRRKEASVDHLIEICKEYGECHQFCFEVMMDRMIEEAIMIGDGTLTNQIVPFYPISKVDREFYESLNAFRENHRKEVELVRLLILQTHLNRIITSDVEIVVWNLNPVGWLEHERNRVHKVVFEPQSSIVRNHLQKFDDDDCDFLWILFILA